MVTLRFTPPYEQLVLEALKDLRRQQRAHVAERKRDGVPSAGALLRLERVEELIGELEHVRGPVTLVFAEEPPYAR